MPENEDDLPDVDPKQSDRGKLLYFRQRFTLAKLRERLANSVGLQIGPDGKIINKGDIPPDSRWFISSSSPRSFLGRLYERVLNSMKPKQ
jgi:hypothetical protein